MNPLMYFIAIGFSIRLCNLLTGLDKKYTSNLKATVISFVSGNVLLGYGCIHLNINEFKITSDINIVS